MITIYSSDSPIEIGRASPAGMINVWETERAGYGRCEDEAGAGDAYMASAPVFVFIQGFEREVQLMQTPQKSCLENRQD